ncbi:hypothetical protein D3C85_1643690 [compost metagenome]
MASSFQACANTGQRPGEVTFIIVDQLVGVGGVLLRVTIAGDDQVIGQRAGLAMQMHNQRFAVPVQQPFIPPTHTLAAAARQEQNGAGWQL